VADDGGYGSHALDLWQWAQSPLNNGQTAQRARARLERILIKRLVAKEIVQAAQPAMPEVDAAHAIILGYKADNNHPVPVDIDILNRHLLVIGSTGAGKTTFLAWLIYQLVEK
jgi:DNA helicase HerA-like ATPase